MKVTAFVSLYWNCESIPYAKMISTDNYHSFFDTIINIHNMPVTVRYNRRGKL